MEQVRARFVPFHRKAVVEMLRDEGKLEGEELGHFLKLVEIITAYYHFVFHAKLEALKEAYYPFDLDRDTRPLRDFTAPEEAASRESLVRMLREVLNDGNFEELSREEMDGALAGESLFSLAFDVDFEDFEECFAYRRGVTVRQEEVKHLVFWKKTVDVLTYERVVLYIHFREARDEEDQSRGVGLKFEPGSTVVKLFKEMPCHDLEMLFPNTEIGMRMKDKLLLGVPAVGGAIPILVLKVLPHVLLLISLALGMSAGKELSEGQLMQGILQAFMALGIFLSYCWRQWVKYRSRRIEFLQTLTEGLYFRSLDNNAGVFHHLIDAAEEEEVKEAILGYYFLLGHGPQTGKELDQLVESWFQEKYDTVIDFEVNGALSKLRSMGIGSEDPEGRWSVMPPTEALAHVDGIWDAFFDYSETVAS